MLASDATVDRDGDIIEAKGWELDNYLKNPVVLWSHDYASVPLAACIKIVRTNDQLILTHKFPPEGMHKFADMVLHLYNEKVIRAGSVGFIPLKSKPIKNGKDGRAGKRFTRQELLEHSLCAIPSNPNALVQQALKARPCSHDMEQKIREELLQIGSKGPRIEELSAGITVAVPKSFNLVSDKSKNRKLIGATDMLTELFKKQLKIYGKLTDLAKAGKMDTVEYDSLQEKLAEVGIEIAKQEKIEKFNKQRQFPIDNPNLKVTDKNPAIEERMYFQDKEGKEYVAVNNKENLTDLDETVDGIGPGSAGKIIAAHVTGDFSKLNEAEMKQHAEGTGSAGGFMLPIPVSNRVIDLARNKAVVMKAGAYTMPIKVPELTLIKIASDPTAYWRKENAEITESEGSFEPVKIKVMVCGALIRVSLELLEDASNAGSTLEKMLSSALALEIDRVGLLGSGAGEPRGIDACENVNEISMGTNGAALTNYDPFLNAMEDVAENNGEATACIYAPRTHFSLGKLKEATTNAPLQPPALFEKLRKYYTNQIGVADTQGTASNCSKAFVGAFKNLCYAMRKNITIEASKAGGGSSGDDAFARMEVLIRAYLRMDLAVLRETHFTKIIGIKPS
jgi:HK97 family phage major capsid protein